MAATFQRTFNFAVLSRYRWRAVDFQDFQDNGLVPMIRGSWEGLANGSVLRGLDLPANGVTGLNFTINPGIAVGPTGNLMVLNQPVTASLPAATAPWGARHVVVIQPLVSTPASSVITPPTQPLTQAPLVFDQYAQIKVYDGNGASGQIPATGPNDVVLFSVRLANGATAFSPSGSSNVERDYLGRRNIYADGMGTKKLLAYDERFLAYSIGAPSIGIKPSQSSTGLSYVGNQTPSIWPKSGGNYNGDSGDTFLNFTTGAISGSDLTSGSFSPQIPSANNFQWALVSIGSNDTITVAFGTQGTYLQCRLGLKNQTTTGAGSVPANSLFKVAYVLLGSVNGTAITELEVYDARSFGANIPTTAPTVSHPEYFGSGADGNFSASSGTTTLTRDMYYNNLTLSGTAKIVTAGFRIFVAGTLDISAAGEGAINLNGASGSAGTNGGSGGAGNGGSGGTGNTAEVVGGSTSGASGGNGVSGGGSGGNNGTNGTNGTASTLSNGGSGGAGGAGGNGPAAGAGGTGGSASSGGVASGLFPISRLVAELIRNGVGTISGGCGGGSGGSGATVTGATFNSGGGGGAGAGAGVVYIAAAILNRGSSTALGAIQALGGSGANAGTPYGNVIYGNGGSGGGGGGGGGWIYLVVGQLTGTTATNCLDASGGSGGAGSAGYSSNTTGGNGGGGGGGGNGGRITTINISSGVISDTSGSTGASGTAGGSASGATGGTGGAGGAGNTFQVSL